MPMSRRDNKQKGAEGQPVVIIHLKVSTSITVATTTRANTRTSLKNCSARASVAVVVGPRSADYHANVELTLTQAATTHQQVFTVNERNIRITVPAGIQDKQKIKLSGQGGEGQNGGPRGDIYITFHVLPDSRFERRGDDLHAKIDIDLFTALLGGEAFVETLSGTVKVKIKPETQSGSKIRLKGKGFPRYKQDGQYGDFYAEINVILPTNLSEEQKRLLKQVAALNG